VDDLPTDVDLQSPDRRLLLWAYCNGVFPMADPDTHRLEWFCPDPRGIIPIDDRFHVPRNLARLVRQGKFEIRSDSRFDEVIRACAAPRIHDDETWIDGRIIGAYGDLHRHDHAHTVEAWLDGELVGGLYGVHVGGAFFGESMFSRPELGGSNASKVCLVHLVEHLRNRGFALLDTQFWNEHLDQFGCVEIPASEYRHRLDAALALDIAWGWPA
jgi:leucyl/phenylalanyl-tRNA--protein transferase